MAGAADCTGCVAFDIPPQPLARAIEAFGAATGQSVVYDSALASGLVSPSVRGRMRPDEALARLLDGSGLDARRVSADALVLTRAAAPAAAALPAGEGERYYGLVQRQVAARLCACPRLAEGRHRLALQLWFDRAGRLRRSTLLDTAGDPALAAAVDTALRGIELGAPVPDGIAQPFTLLVLPRGAGYHWNCPAPDAAAADEGGGA
ncbi:STN domain-containing protein [Luteimonas huabeiensis]|uniref:STN domain-containing protein n=1 Tax=Luteimonas huabeiensis TaxID=1244513 RepID=UPI0004B76D9B|nr:STN domain-containing protein [Luteimonas huabeiensis]